MLSIDLATNDIDIEENQVITEEHVGRQAKRFKAASTLAEVGDLPQVGEAEVGKRFIGLMEVHSRYYAGHPERHHENAPMQQTLARILETVERNALGIQQNAMGLERIEINLQQNIRSVDACARARQYNVGAVIPEHRVMALPNFDNVIPVGFPLTCGEFNAMSVAQLDMLLVFYEYPQIGNRAEKLQTLRQHCGINTPKVHQ